MKNIPFLAATAALCLAIPAAVSFGAAQPKLHYIPSGAMEPTLHVDTYILVNNSPYQNISQVKRGDIIVYRRFDPQAKKPMEFVTRVVGLPGDKVQTTNNRLIINGRALSHVLIDRLRNPTRFAPLVSRYQEVNGQAKYQVQYGDNLSPSRAFSSQVPQNQLFCLGDNRDNAYDSRFTGPVPITAITGKKP